MPLMSIGRGLRGKEGEKHEKDYVGFVGYGDFNMWLCVEVHDSHFWD